ncbi:MAG TPA: hypothetical protein PLS67_00740 [Accumulibacter sp.]|jgi:hypothetical protein|nr:hypothetical protein [Accumulibacter sp.]HQC79028.1 hypothetical protein [Accumulibacter sp.]
MIDPDKPLDADELLTLSDRIEDLSPNDAEWVGRLWRELIRLRIRETAAHAEEARVHHEPDPGITELDEQLAQVALDTAEWLRTLWDVGYMGAGNFRSDPRSTFPTIDLEDVRKSSLFARIRQGKHALPFPPPTRRGLPWHELVEGGEDDHPVSAEIIPDEAGVPFGAIIEACAEWEIVHAAADRREFVVQHQGKGPNYRLRLADDGNARLRRESPASVCKIHRQGRGGLHSYTLEWSVGGEPQFIPLRAATWTRAESEAGYWLAITHPEMYGKVRFERHEQ